jgi:glutamate-ammonia-ligase adenylyltransferase
MGKDLQTVPEALREKVERWLERYGEVAHAGDLSDLVACSEFAGSVVLRDKDWFLENVPGFSEPPDPRALDSLLPNGASAEQAKPLLRRFRNRYLLHVIWREVFGLADLDETLESLSSLADHMLETATDIAERALEPRYGVVRDADGSKVPLVILGMGKLGGRELNLSSDVDLIFLYPDDGKTDGGKCVSAQEYFGRLSMQVIALLDETTVDGFVFRIDTRLRPFGESGPPVVSFGALESYLLQHGRDWERYAYVKARVVGPYPGDDVVRELGDTLIRPFVYRRYIDYGVFQSLREMHAMIEAEVKRRELRDNIKLGPGGIREAEFVVQSMQLVRGGNDPGLQACALQDVLPLLVNNRGLSAEGAAELRAGYRFLRRVENFIQAIRDRQTHDLPSDEVDRARLTLAMGYADWDTLRDDIERHRDAIGTQFDQVAFRERESDTPFLTRAARAWEAGADTGAWVELLDDEAVPGAKPIAELLVGFASAMAKKQIDAISLERLRQFVPRLVMAVAQSAHPEPALVRTLAIVERVLRRSAYLSLLNENRGALSRLVELCGRSSYIADEIARYPVLLDELLDPGVYSESVTRADIATELQARLGEDDGDSEARVRALAQFQRTIMFRIAVADFNGMLPIMKVSDGLTWLAEVVLEEALRVAWRDLVDRHGVPHYTIDDDVHEAGFGIIAYGKLGGLELSYGSDLDIVFLHDSHGAKQETDGARPLDNGMFFGRLVRRLTHFLSMQTGSGQLYEVDTRLRPDGHKGLLVTNTEAFERYQEQNAWTWEHQALLRARPVAGSPRIAAEFDRIRRETLVGRVRRDTLRQDVIDMRKRMRKELDRSDREAFDLKHGRGGIGDIEFLVQYLVLANAHEHPDVTFWSDNIRQLDSLVEAGCVASQVRDALQDAYRDYRLRSHHLGLDDQSALVAQEEFTGRRAYVAKTWDEWLG